MNRDFDSEAPWNRGVRGEQVLPLINQDAAVMRVKAGPGTGKTFGLSRRAVRVLHPDGLDVANKKCLVVAFNRVIASDLRDVIGSALVECGVNKEPTVRTIHALCLDVLGEDVRLLLDHEREAALYDARVMEPQLREDYDDHAAMEQALRDHEAGHATHALLKRIVENWLELHRAALISDVPSILQSRMAGGDFEAVRYGHVIVDEFQDLTSIEQDLVVRLRAPGGQLVALGDPRQSVYAFRGNNREGLDRLDTMPALAGTDIVDVPMTECQRCPREVVEAANHLMVTSGETDMVAASEASSNVHLVHWKTPVSEARGMARAIVDNIDAHADDKHLAMVTRRQFGYALRNELHELRPDLAVDVSFSESILELWSVREAFLFFCLLADPDPPTWRGWLGYQDPDAQGRGFKAADRNAGAYLRFREHCGGTIKAAQVCELADEARNDRRGAGGASLWDRAVRFRELLALNDWSKLDPDEVIRRVFNPDLWVTDAMADAETARLDLTLLRDKALEALPLLGPDPQATHSVPPLRQVARDLRYRIATREPFETSGTAALLVATLWGAKGLTADHVYVIGLCNEAIPGKRTEEYPGDDVAYREEQRRLFYVSITRSKTTLVLSRPTIVQPGEAARLRLAFERRRWPHWAELRVSDFLRELMELPFLNDSIAGDDWTGCVDE